MLGPESPRDVVARLAGGKGFNLWLLSSRGARVPPFVIVGLDAFEAFVAENETVLDEHAQERILNGRMSAALTADIANSLRGMGAVAVRSSALAEDGASHSFAGQLQSFLYVTGADAVVQSVRKCWASAFTPHAVAYMRQHGLPVAAMRVAVVIQEMVDATISGVAFTVDPVTGNPAHVVISAVRGLGEGLVSGLLDSDNFTVDGVTLTVLRRDLVKKETQLLRAPDGGVTEQPVPLPLQEVPALSDAQVLELARAAKNIEAGYKTAQDIEWAFADGKLFILQTRPVTTRRPRQPVQIWDNSNIIESYSGVTSPMTFTFARNAYHHVYVQFCEVMGVPQKVVEASDPVLRNMLGYLDGRIYYNLLNWYYLIGLFPGFKNNKSYMEGMMGVRESLPADAQALLRLPPVATFRERLAQRWLGVKMAVRFFRLDATVAEFQRYFHTNYERYRTTQFNGKSVEELLIIYHEMESVFLTRWRAPIINDFFAMIFFGLLRKLTQSFGLDTTGALQNDLLCGEGGVESAVPTEQLIELATLIGTRPAWKTAFLSDDAAALQEKLRTSSEFAEIRTHISAYLDRFGFRCMNELKLEEPDLHSNPQFIFTALKNYLEHTPRTVPQLREREQSIRTRAETLVAAKLSGWRLVAFRWVLKHARKTVKNRENLRFARTKVFGLARRILDAAGEDLCRRGVLKSARDVYFLHVDELHGLVDGSLVTQNLAALVNIRKDEHAAFLTRDPDDRFVTRGAVYLGQTLKTKAATAASADGMLRGVACCPGQLKTKAKVIHNPRDDMRLGGDILVAQRTDPGWTPLFPSAGGILVERGSLLSHSAIVARELGIPCVVGIPGVTQLIHTGDTVQMDGAEGWARVVHTVTEKQP